ncbi:MAG: TetR family transcriptional regulator [Burkholderiaceae bacterium]
MLPPLPPPLDQALLAGVEAGPKRQRTRRQLLLAAMQVYSQKGVAGASLQDIAAAAGVASGTIYNYFSTREEVAEHAALWLATTLCECIAQGHAAVRRGAERMAFGNRRYLWLAEHSPAWALLLLDVGAAVPAFAAAIRAYAVEDLRLGLQQKEFRIFSEAAAVDLVGGTIGSAMASIAHGQAPAGHASAVVATVLQGLGLTAGEAQDIARLPLPELVVPEPADVEASRGRPAPRPRG